MSLTRSGRVMVYPNEVPFETDVLRTNLYGMVALSYLAQTILGTGTSNSTKVCGLSCTPTSPPSLGVNIGPGVVYQSAVMDATAYSSIPADTSDILYKQGINLNTTLISGLSAPTGLSQQVYYLIQAQLITQDVNVVSSPYFNSANPLDPDFISLADTRQDSVNITAKTGIPSVSPSIPAPDAGYVGLYTILVSQGQTTITSGNIAVYSSAPFITEGLTQKISSASISATYVTNVNLQNSVNTYGTDTGSANNYAASLTPTLASLVTGLRVQIKIANRNTGASTLNINGLGAKPIRKTGSTGVIALSGYELINGFVYDFSYDGTNFLLLNQQKPNIYSGMTMVANQTIPNGGAYVDCGFDTVQFDAFSLANTSAHTITTNITGYWRYNILISTNDVIGNATGSTTVNLVKNGTALLRAAQFPFGGDTDSNTMTASAMLQCNAGDVFKLNINNTGNLGSISMNDDNACFFQMEFIGN